jgi:hypothetical protein
MTDVANSMRVASQGRDISARCFRDSISHSGSAFYVSIKKMIGAHNFVALTVSAGYYNRGRYRQRDEADAVHLGSPQIEIASQH